MAIGSLMLCLLINDNLTIITSLEVGFSSGKASIVFLTEKQVLGAMPGHTENSVPHLLRNSLIQSP